VREKKEGKKKLDPPVLFAAAVGRVKKSSDDE